MNINFLTGLIICSVFVNTSVLGQTPTFHLDVAPIIYNNCTQCHRVGEIGPMPLTTYEEVSAYGSFIEFVTASGYMPPWTPDHTYTTLVGERVLSDDDIQTIADWVAGGMLEGNIDDNPGLPEFPTGSQIGEPDLILSMAEPYIHGGDNEEQYQVFIIPTGVTETKEIQAVEIRPGNFNIAHHGLVGYTNNPISFSAAEAMDAADPAPGYESFGDYGVDVEEFLFGGWVPGTPPMVTPPTIGKFMEPGSQLLLQMHYGPSSIEQSDLTEINIFFADEPITREVQTEMMTTMDLSVPFYIPANEISVFHGTRYVSDDISMLSITPHSHLLGKSWLVYATSSDNQDTIPIIYIPDWDFHWQGIFTFPQLLHIPGGYTINAIAEYDNTVSNPDNPNNPPQDAYWGDFTTDEMFVMFAQYVNYLPGDEEISSTSIEDNVEFVFTDEKLMPAWPNPAIANSNLTIGFSLRSNPAEVTIELFDINGKRISVLLESKKYDLGSHLINVTLPNLSSGSYIYRMITSSGYVSSKLLEVQ
ncbi:MAG: hypothetical protein COA49_05680 [Bacteroidetes bacterium]|nr:MAG: hypothetical protein COA49_05680 [Bacteroidota bacterium]